MLRSNALNYSVYEKREPHFSKKARLPDLNFGVMFYLPKLPSRLFSDTKDW